MKLDDINTFIDVHRACSMLASRIDGISYDTDIYFRTSSGFAEVATVVDKPIRREPFGNGAYKLSFTYRGIEFWRITNDAEVAQC